MAGGNDKNKVLAWYSSQRTKTSLRAIDQWSEDPSSVQLCAACKHLRHRTVWIGLGLPLKYEGIASVRDITRLQHLQNIFNTLTIDDNCNSWTPSRNSPIFPDISLIFLLWYKECWLIFFTLPKLQTAASFCGLSGRKPSLSSARSAAGQQPPVWNLYDSIMIPHMQGSHCNLEVVDPMSVPNI